MTLAMPVDLVMSAARAPDGDALTARSARPVDGTAPTFDAGRPADAAPRSATPPETFVKFEAAMLQSFIQSMLPTESEAVYGEGLAGDMWRSMLAEQIATVMAERGGIGIADRVLSGRYGEGSAS